MKIEKISNNSYRVRKMMNGINVCVYFDHKPTEKEILIAVTDKLNYEKSRAKETETIGEAIEKYIVYRGESISPTTQREYIRLKNRLSEGFLRTRLCDIDQFIVDNEIERLRGTTDAHKGIKPKSIMNYMSMVKTVVTKYSPNIEFSLDKIQFHREEKDIHVPTKSEMVEILKYINENDPMFYVPIALAALCGLRRSEIVSLTVDDLTDDNHLIIDSAKVCNAKNEWVEKGTKTKLSTRTVPVPENLAQRIRLQGYIYNGNPHSIGKALQRVQKEMGLECCNLHILRHFYATELSQMGVKEADILYLGGWSKGSDIMKRVYRHSRIQTDKERREQIARDLSSSFFD